MAPVIPAIFAGVAAGTTFSVATGLAIGFSTSAFVTSLVLTGAASALRPKPSIPNIGGGGNSGGGSGGGGQPSKTVTGRQSN